MAKLQRKHHEAVAKILAEANQDLRKDPGMSARTMRFFIALELEAWLASEDPMFDVRRFRQAAQLPQSTS